MAVGVREALEHDPALVNAAIVDEHKLVAVGHLRDAAREAVVQRNQTVGARVNGHDDCELNVGFAQCASSLSQHAGPIVHDRPC